MKILDIYLENVKNIQQLNLSFGNRMNIITGPNGTGKSTILNCLILGINNNQIDRNITKTDSNRILINIDKGEPSTECSFENNGLHHSVITNEEVPILAFNPKRNIPKEDLNAIIQRILPQRDWAKFNRETASHYDDGVYNQILSIAEIISLKMKTIPIDQTPQTYIDSIIADFNNLSSKIFPNLKITTIDYVDIGNYTIHFENNGKEINLNDLSTGEKELLSLLMNIEYYKEDFSILIIDEPEVHLNWSLENKLFDYLLELSKTQNKQIILTTHSRVLLEYLEHKDVKLINLAPDIAGNVTTNSKNLAQELEEIVGKVNLLERYDKIVVCEDSLHKKLLEQVNEAKLNSGKLKVMTLGDKGAVISFIRGIERFPTDEFKDKFFGIVDKDNDTAITEARLKSLAKYSVENYLLQSSLLFQLDQTHQSVFTSQNDLESFMAQKILDKTGETISPYNQGVIDGKKIKKALPDVYEHLGYTSEDEFLEKYIPLAQTTNALDEFIV